MVWICLALVPLAFVLSAGGCGAVRAVSLRRGLLDAAGSEAHKPAAARPVPNTGGVGVFWAVSAPLLAGAGLVAWSPVWLTEGLGPAAVHLPGLRASLPALGWLLGAVGVLHVAGLIDDRRALPPWPKLGLMLAVAGGVAGFGGTRLLSLLDGYGWPGAAAAVTLSVVWIVVMTNAMNFLDNMDGLCAGVAAVAAGLYLAATLVSGQWFVAGLCALLLGAVLGFLVWNLPPARLYLGDGGSLVVGLLLAVIAIRTAYFDSTGGRDDVALPGAWYGLLMPLLVLAVPLYDFVSVVVIRLARGQSPMTGDHNHFSHRLLRRGLSKRGVLAVVLLATLATGAGGVMLGRLAGWQAALVGVQAAAVVGVLALLEFGGDRGGEAAVKVPRTK